MTRVYKCLTSAQNGKSLRHQSKMETNVAFRVIFFLFISQAFVLCRHTRKTRDAANNTTHINAEACVKTDKNDTACFILRRCNANYQSCPIIQSKLGLVICHIVNLDDDFSKHLCNRMCHTKGFNKNFPIGDDECLESDINNEEQKPYKPEEYPNLNYWTLHIKNIDNYKEYVGPLNLPKDPGCKSLDVPESICDDFTKYRVLLCGGSVWQQAQCYNGDCGTKKWADEYTNGCQYAVVRRGVALCPLNSQFSCRFICRKKNGTCSKKRNRFSNTTSGRKLMSSIFNITKNDWKKLEKGL